MSQAEGLTPLAAWQAWLAEPLAEALGPGVGARPLEVLRPTGSVGDNPVKLLVRDQDGAPVAVVHGSTPDSPDMAARSLRRARAAREALGAELGSVVLEPLASGAVDGISYTIHPFCESLSDGRVRWRLQRRRLGPVVFRWLREVTRHTAREASPEALESAATELSTLAGSDVFSAAVRGAAERTLERLQRDRWRPRRILAHNDFWKHNLLLRARGARRPLAARLVVIDWTGSSLAGHGIYDLVRLAQSFGLPAARLAREIERHCEILACDPADAPAHLMLAITQVRRDADRLSDDWVDRLACRCLETLRGARG